MKQLTVAEIDALTDRALDHSRHPEAAQLLHDNPELKKLAKVLPSLVLGSLLLSPKDLYPAIISPDDVRRCTRTVALFMHDYLKEHDRHE